MITELNTQFGALTSVILEFALLLAGVSTLAMAFVEAYKGLTKAKTRFHRRSFANWAMRQSDIVLDERVIDIERPGTYALLKPFSESQKFKGIAKVRTGLRSGLGLAPRVGPDDFEKLRYDLGLAGTSIASSDDYAFNYFFGIPGDDAVYSLDHSQFLGKLQMAFERTLRSPSAAPTAFVFIATGNPEAAARYCEQIELRDDPSKEHDNDALEAVFTELHSSIIERLDTFSIVTEYTWGRIMRFMSVVIGAELMYPILTVTNAKLSAPMPGLVVLTLCMVGGALAPVSKNIVSAIRKLRSL